MCTEVSNLVVSRVADSNENEGDSVGDLVADEVIWAVAASMAVGGNVANQGFAGGKTSLVVDSKAKLGGLALGDAEAVLAVTAGDNLGRQFSDSANLASNVSGVVARELEASVLDAVVLANVEFFDVDILVCGWIGSRAAAVCRVGAVRCLRSGRRDSGSEQSRSGDSEAHCVD